MSTINVTDFHQPQSFLDESEALFDVLAGVDASLFTRPTRFKGWTIDDILAHLHIWNWALEQAIVDVPAFDTLLLQFKAHVKVAPVRAFENAWVAPLHGQELLAAWRAQCRQTTALVQSVDPKLRTRWFGPNMSALKYHRTAHGDLGARPGDPRLAWAGARADRSPQGHRGAGHPYV